MIGPGSKGWIAKYVQLVETNELTVVMPKPEEFTRAQFNHHVLAQTGIVFGYPSSLLYGKEWDTSKWTHQEQLTVLLFESLLFTHINFKQRSKFDANEFLSDLDLFYKKHRVQSLLSMVTFFLKESASERLERILAKRTEVPKHLTNTKSWMSYLNNAFIYLDIILFEDFLKNNRKQSLDYQQLAMLALGIISISSNADGIVEENEKQLFKTFLISADLGSEEKELAKLRFYQGISLNELEAEKVELWNFKRYLLDLSVLTIFLNHQPKNLESKFLEELRLWLPCSERDLDEAIFVTDQFILNNNRDVPYLKDASAMEFMVNNVSNRWIKIIGRNKDKLALELKQSKELVFLIKKSTTEELTKEEKDKVKTQFLDIVKSMPALAIFLLPGGAVLLPLVLKIIPDLVPSAFKENELEE